GEPSRWQSRQNLLCDRSSGCDQDRAHLLERAFPGGVATGCKNAGAPGSLQCLPGGGEGGDALETTDQIDAQRALCALGERLPFESSQCHRSVAPAPKVDPSAKDVVVAIARRLSRSAGPPSAPPSLYGARDPGGKRVAATDSPLRDQSHHSLRTDCGHRRDQAFCHRTKTLRLLWIKPQCRTDRKLGRRRCFKASWSGSFACLAGAVGQETAAG